KGSSTFPWAAPSFPRIKSSTTSPPSSTPCSAQSPQQPRGPISSPCTSPAPWARGARLIPPRSQPKSSITWSHKPTTPLKQNTLPFIFERVGYFHDPFLPLVNGDARRFQE